MALCLLAVGFTDSLPDTAVCKTLGLGLHLEPSGELGQCVGVTGVGFKYAFVKTVFYEGSSVAWGQLSL